MENKYLTRKSAKETVGMDELVASLLASRTAFHKLHLNVSGVDSYAAHMALNSFYDEIGDLVDAVAESYQGATTTLLKQVAVEPPILKSVPEAISYLNTLYSNITSVQATCTYSEINNELDNIKSLINSTKYKLTFLH